MTPRGRLALGAAAAAVVALVVYVGTLANAPVWDDADLVVDNPYLASARGAVELLTHDLWTASARREESSFYRPLTMLTYAVNRLFGAGAASYHAGNALLHAACCTLLVVLAGTQATRGRAGPATLAGLVFALAPLNVEAVAWIAGRFDLLGTALVLLALWANGGRGPLRSALAALAISAALFCKESFAIGLPLLLAHDLLVARRRVRDLMPKYAACLVAVAGFFVIRRAIGVMSVAAVQSTGPVALLQGYAFLLGAFTRAFAYPDHLDPFRAYHAPGAAVVAAVVAAAAVAMVTTAWLAWERPKDDRRSALAFGVLWSLIALAPASLVGPNLNIVGDRYAYLPLAGASFAAAALAGAAWPRGLREAALPALGAAFVLAVFAGRTVTRVAEWRDERTLYSRSVQDDPDSPHALYMLGALHAQAGELGLADPLLKAALAHRPRSWQAHNAMCVVRLRQRRLDEAERHCRASAEVHADNPRVWINLASIQVTRGAWEAGLEHATHAIEVGPFAVEGRYLRAVCLANLGQLGAARAEADRALALRPEHAGALSLLAQLRAHDAP